MSLPVLYSFRRCPYAIRARLALHYSAIPVEIKEVALRNKPAEMLALSPKGTVPVLHLPDGQVLEQSLDIMRWALAQRDPEGWLSSAPAEAIQALIDDNDMRFKPLLDRYKYAERHPDQARETWRELAVQALLGPLERHLQSRSHVLGDRISLADMALLPFVRQFAQVDRSWWDTASGLSAVAQWLSKLTSSSLFEAVMARDLASSKARCNKPTPSQTDDTHEDARLKYE